MDLIDFGLCAGAGVECKETVGNVSWRRPSRDNRLRPRAGLHDRGRRESRQTIKGGVVIHNLPQEAPKAFAEAIVEVDGY